MSATIDERIVQMKFDNRQFESNVSTTMSTLDKLKAKLDFTGAAKGLDDISKAANKVDLSGLEKSASSVEVKFTAMSIAAITAIQNLTNAAINAGTQMAKSLSIDQVTAGFDKYTEKTAAVQTIMNATGKSVEEVTAALGKLQWFSDETSYSFVDMTSNVGKFTSAGVELNTAVSAMQGIANAAAHAGANSTEASRAMYNFSQALAKGYVQLIDWKSIENANMATLTFKQTLIDSAVSLGTLIQAQDGYTTAAKGSEVSATNFNEALSDGWLSTEVLLDALGKYSAYSDRIYEVSDSFDTCAQAMEATSEAGMELGAQAFKAAQQAKTFREAIDATKDAVSSGWMETFEIVFGDFEESVNLWTALTNKMWDVFASGAEDRNERLTSGLMSGWKQFSREGISDMEKLQSAIISVVGGEDNFKRYNVMAGGNADDSFVDSLKNGWLTAEQLGEAINYLVSQTKDLSEAELEAAGYTQKDAEEYLALKEAVENGSISLEEYAETIGRMSGRENIIQAISNAFNALESIVGAVTKAFRELFPALDGKGIWDITEAIRAFTEQLQLSEEALYTIKVIAKVLLLPFKLLFEVAKVGIRVFSGLITIAFRLVNALLSIPASTDKVKNALKNALGEERYNRLATALSSIVTALSEAFQVLGLSIKGIFKSSIVNAIGVVVGLFKSLGTALAPIANTLINAIIVGFEKLATIITKSNLIEWVGFIRDTVSNAGQNIIAWIGIIAQGIVDLIHGVANKEPVAWVENLKEKIGILKSFLGDFIKEFDIAKIFSETGEVGQTLLNVLNGLGDAFTRLLGRLTPAKVLIAAFGVTLVMMMISITNAIRSFGLLGDSLNLLTRSISARIKPRTTVIIERFSRVVLLLAGALIVLSLVEPVKLAKVTAAIISLMGAIMAMTAIMAVLNKFLLTTTTAAANFKMLSKGMLMMSVAVFALSGSLVLLSNLNASEVVSGIFAIAGVLTALTAASIVMAKSAPELTKGSAFLIGFAISIRVVVASLQSLVKANLNGITKNLITLIAIMGMLSILARVGGKINFSSALGLGVMCLDLLLLAKVLKKLGEIKPQEIIRNLQSYLIMMGLIASLALVIRLAGKSAIGLGVSMIGLASGLLIMAQVVKQLAALSTEEIQNGTKALLYFTSFMAVLIAVTSLANAHAAKMGVAMIGMAAAIIILTRAVDYLGDLSVDEIVKGTAAIGALMGFFSIVLLASSVAGKATAAIVAMTISLGLLTAAIVLVSLIPTEEALGSAISLGLVLMAFGAALRSVQTIRWTKIIVNAVLMMELVGVLTLIIPMLAAMESEEAVPKALALGVVLVAMALASRLMGAIPNAAGAAVTLAALGAVMLELGMVLAVISNLPMGDDLLYKTAVVSLAMTALSAVALLLGNLFTRKRMVTNAQYGARAMAMLGLVMAEVALVITGVSHLAIGEGLTEKVAAITLGLGGLAAVALLLGNLFTRKRMVTNAMNGAVAMAALGLVMAEVALVLGLFVNLTIGEGILEKTLSLTVILAALGALGLLLGKIPIDPVTVAMGGAAIAVLIGELALVIGLLGALYQNETVKSVINSGVEMFGKLGEAIGSFFGNIVGAFIGGATNVTSNLPKVADDLSDFSDNVQPFFENAKNMDPAAIDGVKGLVEALLLLTANDFLSIFTGIFGEKTSLADFGEQLADFADPFSQFLSTISQAGVDKDKVDAASYAAMALAGFVNALPSQGGLLQGLVGQKETLKEFGEGLAEFAVPFSEYLNIIGNADIDEEAVKSSASAAQCLSEFANSLPRRGGAWQDFIGTKTSLTDFAVELESFAPAFVSYAKTMGEIGNFDVVTNSANAAMAISDFANNLPAAGGVWQDIVGTQSLAGFAEELRAFAPAFSEYSDWMKGIDVQAVEGSSNAASMVAEMANKAPLFNGWVQAIAGTTDLSLFGAQLRDFGPALASFSRSIKNSVDTEAVRASVNATEMLIEMSKALDPTGGVFGTIGDFLFGSNDLTSFGDVLKEFGNAFSDYYNSISGIDASQVERVTSSAMDFVELANQISHTDFYAIGQNAIEGLIEGMDSQAIAVKYSAQTLGNDMIDTMKDVLGISNAYSKKFEQIGKHITDGLTKGITDNTKTATDGIVKMGREMLKASQRDWEINSPSKVARDELGRYIVEGIAEGITTDTSAEDAMTKKAQNLVSAFQNELDKHELDMSTADLEYQLWQGLHGDADEAEQNQRLIEALTDKLTIQAKRVRDSNAEFIATSQLMGETAEETQSAYNKYLQEQVNMTDLAQQLIEARAKSAESEKETVDLSREAAQKYYDVLFKYQDSLQKAGFTMDEIEAFARQESGFDPTRVGKPIEQTITTVQDILDEFLNKDAIEVTIAEDIIESVESGTKQAAVRGSRAMTSAYDSGMAIGDVFGEGFGAGFNTNSITSQVQEAFSSTFGEEGVFDFSGTIAGKVDGFVDDIANGFKNAMNKGADLYDQGVSWLSGLLKGAEDEAEVHSPSKRTYEIGMYIIEGLVNGIRDYASLAENAFRSLVSRMLSGTTDENSLVKGLVMPSNETKALMADTISNLMSIAGDQGDTVRQNGISTGSAFIYGFNSSVLENQDAINETFGNALMIAVRSAKDLIESSDYAHPVITPVLDMSEIQKGLNDFSLFKGGLASAGTADRGANLGEVMAALYGSKKRGVNQNEGASSGKAAPVIFNQYNTSPKSLSRREIYRQTNNLLSKMRGLGV